MMLKLLITTKHSTSKIYHFNNLKKRIKMNEKIEKLKKEIQDEKANTTGN